jgi:hypothetical protein
VTVTSESPAERIAHQGRHELVARLRTAFVSEASRAGGGLDGDELERRITDAAQRAGAALWRRSLAQAAMAELGIDLASAIDHPEVLRAHELVGAPPYEPPAAAPEEPAVAEEEPAPAPEEPAVAEEEPAPADEPAADVPEVQAPSDPELEALRVPAVHVTGIEAIKAGDRDIELRFTADSLDVLKRSSGAPIGRVHWSEITSLELPPPRRGLRRKPQELHLETFRGRATFELPGVTDEQLAEHVRPMLERAGIDVDERPDR